MKAEDIELRFKARSWGHSESNCPAGLPEGWRAIGGEALIGFAAEIAVLCEEELADKEMTIGVLDRAVEVREQMEEELMAKQAVMVELLLQVDVWLHDWAEKGGELHLPADDLRLVLRTKLKEAVSAAPKVAWVGKGRVLRFVHKTAIDMAHTGTPFYLGKKLELPGDQQVTVYVLADDKPQEEEE